MALEESLPQSVRRRAGAYFTSPALADALVKPFARELAGDATVLDPTCGAGDLLLASARHFQRSRDPKTLLDRWEQRIFGRDLFEEFVLSARLRMYRAALPSLTSLPNLQDLFPGIQRGCSLTAMDAYVRTSHVLLNPPYTLVRAPDDCEWRTGRVSAAALFMEAAVKHCEPGTRIGAVLPDVLRSGSGYEKWRAMLSRHLKIDSAKIIGRFARWADVDVFLLHGSVRKGSSTSAMPHWPAIAASSSETLSKRFSIAVGPLVDYRSPKRGPWRSYLTVDNAPVWGTVSALKLTHRRFAGTVFKPPFVVVRRTSRAGDLHRMVGTLVVGRAPVAVENHLLVLVPTDRQESTCEDLLRRLETPQTTAWLNERIRCRHLTVGAVNDLPW